MAQSSEPVRAVFSAAPKPICLAGAPRGEASASSKRRNSSNARESTTWSADQPSALTPGRPCRSWRCSPAGDAGSNVAVQDNSANAPGRALDVGGRPRLAEVTAYAGECQTRPLQVSQSGHQPPLAVIEAVVVGARHHRYTRPLQVVEQVRVGGRPDAADRRGGGGSKR